MEDQKTNLPAPARSRYRLYKILTLSLLAVVLLVLAGYGTVEATSSSTFCSSCHNMKPEFNTWKASSHSQVGCKECHIQDGVVSYAKAKLNGLSEVYKLATDTYAAPIHMAKEIPNESCEKCHNMKTTIVTASGDLIIPHNKHLKDDIKCVQCHSGVAHGKVADRNATFKTDYAKWNSTLGKQMMSDLSFTQPTMDECIQCHKTRNVSTDCETCHSTGMKPESHNDPNFLKGNHGKLAEKDIKECNSCHQYMSENPIKDFQEKTASQELINKSSAESALTAATYAKKNTFCQECHSKKPTSHNSKFFATHGTTANKNLDTCKACHDTSKAGLSSKNKVICSSCHTNSHKRVSELSIHPIPLNGIKGPSEKCYTCHSQSTCSSCHKDE
ncbi:NapC/NirT family cytochrome c [Bacillus sp. 1P10SD]|uniref:NapC/NirT family cytochrome c n=1 Tax=Bacillus sp. 1P10SD TaxID=3132265 RepID=UPI0039A53CDF